MSDSQLLNNRYQIIRRLGTGGMAMVYLGRDLMLERQVAIKILRPEFSRSDNFRQRFRQEATAVANLSHPNIVTIHDFGLSQDRLFIVMEYVRGENLFSYLEKKGRLPLEETLRIMVQACAGVGYAHRSGLVHCDIKPHNILVTPDLQVKVADFGIARALASIHTDKQSNTVWGSPLYFSPEQAAGLPPSPASDVYALGVVLYELLCGQTPFQADTPTELARLHRYAQPPPLKTLVPDIPPAIDQILTKVLSKEPATRYRTADQLGRVLLTFSKAQEMPPASAPLPPQPMPEPSPAAMPNAARQPLDINWNHVILGLIALVSVGGLVPFWIWVYFLYHPVLQ